MSSIDAMSGSPINPMETSGNLGDPVPHLNSLLRGEISAAETYRMAINKVVGAEDPAVNVGLLREIQEEHGRAAQAVRERITDLGGEAVDSSGIWGAWAKTVQGTMNLFGDASSLKALKEGEEHGLNEYQSVVEGLDSISQQLVTSQMIPAQQKHINLLDQLIESVGKA